MRNIVIEPAHKVSVPTVQRTIVKNILVITSGLAITGNTMEDNQSKNDDNNYLVPFVIPDAITISSH